MSSAAGYTGADERPEHEDREVCWNIAIKRGIIKASPKTPRDLAEPVERCWRDLKQHYLANHTFAAPDALDHAIHDALAPLNHQRQPLPSPILIQPA
jgi:hypothetical protein